MVYEVFVFDAEFAGFFAEVGGGVGHLGFDAEAGDEVVDGFVGGAATAEAEAEESGCEDAPAGGEGGGVGELLLSGTARGPGRRVRWP